MDEQYKHLSGHFSVCVTSCWMNQPGVSFIMKGPFFMYQMQKSDRVKSSLTLTFKGHLVDEMTQWKDWKQKNGLLDPHQVKHLSKSKDMVLKYFIGKSKRQPSYLHLHLGHYTDASSTFVTRETPRI